MKILFNVDQRRGKLYGLTLKEAMLFSYIKEFIYSEHMQTKNINGKECYRLYLNKILEDLPYMGSLKTIQRAIAGLTKKNIIVPPHPNSLWFEFIEPKINLLSQPNWWRKGEEN